MIRIVNIAQETQAGAGERERVREREEREGAGGGLGGRGGWGVGGHVTLAYTFLDAWVDACMEGYMAVCVVGTTNLTRVSLNT
jgi:hypothetical protein